MSPRRSEFASRILVRHPNAIMAFVWETWQEIAAREVESILDELPEPLQPKARALPVTFERIPNPVLQDEGILPDTLGLFVGPEYSEEGHGPSPLPPQIILFLENLWDFAEGNEEFFAEEVRTTYLHELGHYLGLDEDDLGERGLD